MDLLVFLHLQLHSLDQLDGDVRAICRANMWWSLLHM